MTVDWLDRPLTAVEADFNYYLQRANERLRYWEDNWSRTPDVLRFIRNAEMMLLALFDEALEYWLSRRAICCPDDVDNYELGQVRNIDGPWPSGEYEPR